MAEKKIKWTEQQKRAIVARGSDILVTASAGTGKTAVLSGRCVNIVSDKSTCPDVWSILVLTFTDMAAEEMRSRIADQLTDAYSQTSDPHLYHQLILLQGADISTIHSFCKRIITEFFYEIGLDPTFRVIDADEARLLKAEVLEKTIDWAWRQNHLITDLQQLLFRRDLRTDKGFLTGIIDLSDFLDTIVSRENWYQRANKLAEAANILNTPLGTKQKQIIAEKLRNIIAQLHHAQILCRKENPDSNWPEKLNDSHIKPVEESIELLEESNNWEKFSELIRNFSKPTTYKPRDINNNIIAEHLQGIAKSAIEKFQDISNLAILNLDYLDRLSSSVNQQTRVLI